MKEGILFIWDRIGDYHLARIQACEAELPYAVYSADLAGSDKLYKWKGIQRQNHTILSDKAAEKTDLWKRFSAYRKIIKQNNIKVVAMPYGRLEYHLFLVYARLCGIRTIVFSESWYSRGKQKDALKALLLKIIGQKFFVSGIQTYAHFTNTYRIAAADVVQGYSVVDNSHFEQTTVGTKKNIVCVARYSKEKNLEFLIRCFAKSNLSKHYVLRLVGDGPDKAALLDLVQTLQLQDAVELSGWVPYQDLPNIYQDAYAAILPSTFEPWGLVVNEAMAAGLPILISNTCGCAIDLVEENTNGWQFDPLNAEDCILKMNALDEITPITYSQMRSHSLQRIAQYTPARWAKNISTFLLA